MAGLEYVAGVIASVLVGLLVWSVQSVFRMTINNTKQLAALHEIVNGQDRRLYAVERLASSAEEIASKTVQAQATIMSNQSELSTAIAGVRELIIANGRNETSA